MKAVWHRFLHWLCVRLYFARVDVIGAEHLPRQGPVLFVGLHRNGAVDGLVYEVALGQPVVFLISVQLTRRWLGRLFFDGIGVVRSQDSGDRSVNEDALATCLGQLQSGGRLFVFPEGTSSLGPRHLPFKSGAVQLALDALAAGVPLQVIPVGIHYECAPAFRSKVEVVVGPAIPLDLPSELSPLGRLRELRKRMWAGLEGVGLNLETERDQVRLEQLAYLSTLATLRSWYRSAKAWEGAVPESVARAGEAWDRAARERRLWRHQGVPLFPLGIPELYLVAGLVLAPVVALGILVNAVPFVAAGWAGQRLADDSNVIALWRILIGVPAWLLWVMGWGVASVVGGHPVWFLGYLGTTWLAVLLYYRVKKLGVAVHNALFHADLRPAALRLRETVLAALPAETP